MELRYFRMLDIAVLQELLILETRKYTAKLRGGDSNETLEEMRETIEKILQLIKEKRAGVAELDGL